MTIEILNWGLSVASPTAEAAPLPDRGAPDTEPTGHRDHLRPHRATRSRPPSMTARSSPPGTQSRGPALIVEPQTTTLLSADFTAFIDAGGNIRMEQTP
jgi:N-methylhydantoinase A